MSLTKPMNLETDLAFRAPLGQLPSSVDNNSDEKDYSPQIRPLLYRMYIACRILRFGTEVRFSALVFLHRYTAAICNANNDSNVLVAAGANKKSNNKSKQNTTTDNANMEWVAAACLFLACKAEEQPRRLRDVINLVHMLLAPPPPTDEDGGSSAYTENIVFEPNPPNLNEAYWEAKKKIVETEQDVLRWLAFDVSVSHPHRAVTLLLEDDPSKDKLVEIAFRRLNDALFHSPALKHPVMELACAAIQLAAEETNVFDPNYFLNMYCTRYKLSKTNVALAKIDLEESTKVLRQIGRDK